MDSVMRNLPIEIEEQILLRTPARSVLRLTTVCKQWRSLISDPRFVKDQVNRFLSDEGNIHHRMVGRFMDCSEISSQLIDHPSLNLTDFILLFKSVTYSRILSSCNGLLLQRFYNFGKFLLWNPLLREKRNYLQPRNLTSSPWHACFVGLGYALSVDDYKVVVLGSKTFSTSSAVLEGEIYSLKNDSWRSIPSYTVPINLNLTCVGTPGIHVQGSVYWAVSRNEFILAFDLTTEKFIQIETPPPDWSSLSSYVSDGCGSRTRKVETSRSAHSLEESHTSSSLSLQQGSQ